MPLGEISDILNPITENVISVNIIPCILQFSILEITSYLQYICLWRINLQSALSARHRQTHTSIACKGYQFLRPYCSLERSIFAALLVSGEGTHQRHTMSISFTGGCVVAEVFWFAYFHLLFQDCSVCIFGLVFQRFWMVLNGRPSILWTHFNSPLFQFTLMVRWSSHNGGSTNITFSWEMFLFKGKGVAG